MSTPCGQAGPRSFFPVLDKHAPLTKHSRGTITHVHCNGPPDKTPSAISGTSFAVKSEEQKLQETQEHKAGLSIYS